MDGDDCAYVCVCVCELMDDDYRDNGWRWWIIEEDGGVLMDDDDGDE